MYIPPHLRNNKVENEQINMATHTLPSNEMSWSDKIKMTKEQETKKEYPPGYMIFEIRNNTTTIVQNYPKIENDINDNLYVLDRHNEYDLEDDMKDLSDGCIDSHNYDNEIHHLNWLERIETEWDMEVDDSGGESDSQYDSEHEEFYEDFK